jgi:hypothetical protein
VTVREQPARAALATPRMLHRIAWAGGIFCLLADVAIISRAPIPWLDEVYLVSVANSISSARSCLVNLS